MALKGEADIKKAIKKAQDAKLLELEFNFEEHQTDWDDVKHSYEFEDLKDEINPDTSTVTPCLVRALFGVVLSRSKPKKAEGIKEIEEEYFRKADIEFHTALVKSRGNELENLPCLKAYAHYLLTKKRFFHAENVLKFEIRSDPEIQRRKEEFVEVYFLLGLSLLQQRKFQDAIEAFTLYCDNLEYFKTVPTRPLQDYNKRLAKGYRYLGNALYGTRTKPNTEKAKKFFKESYKVSQNSLHAVLSHNNLANILINEYENTKNPDRLEEAEREIETVEKSINQNTDALKNEAQTKEDFVYYLSLVFDTFGMLKILEEDLVKAEEYLHKALEFRNQSKIPPTAIRYHLGLIYERQNQLHKAKSEYEGAYNTRRDGGSETYVSKALVGLGVLNFNKTKYDEAERNFKEALEFDLQNQDAIDFLRDAIFSKTTRPDWLSWWSKSDSRKATLAGLIVIIIAIGTISYLFDNTLEETTVTFPNGTIKEIEAKITKKQTISETHLALIGIIVFVILLPSIKKIKAGGVELEAQELQTPIGEGRLAKPRNL